MKTVRTNVLLVAILFIALLSGVSATGVQQTLCYREIRNYSSNDILVAVYDKKRVYQPVNVQKPYSSEREDGVPLIPGGKTQKISYKTGATVIRLWTLDGKHIAEFPANTQPCVGGSYYDVVAYDHNFVQTPATKFESTRESIYNLYTCVRYVYNVAGESFRVFNSETKGKNPLLPDNTTFTDRFRTLVDVELDSLDGKYEVLFDAEEYVCQSWMFVFPLHRPTKAPTLAPTTAPTPNPTKAPTSNPTSVPTQHPTKAPTKAPTKVPTMEPTKGSTPSPTKAPTKAPTRSPTKGPTRSPTKGPTKTPVVVEVPSRCGSLEGCFLVNLDDSSASETPLGTSSSYEFVAGRSDGYSIRCDTSGTINKVTFVYPNGEKGEHVEWGMPWWMRGDSGAWINRVQYLSKREGGCGKKTVTIIGEIWTDECFNESFELEASGC